MDYHGITMKGDLKTDNIKAQDGTDSVTIANSTGDVTLTKKTDLQGETTFSYGSPSAGTVLQSTGNGGIVEWVKPNVQPNLFINSSFEMAQKATSWTFPGGNAGEYGTRWGVDGWYFNDSNNAGSGSRKNLSDADRIALKTKRYIQQNRSSSADTRLSQKVPIIWESSGRTMTFSCWYKTSATFSDNLNFRCTRVLGEAASGSSGLEIDQIYIDTLTTPTTVWTHYTTTFTIDSMSGITINDANEACLNFMLDVPAGGSSAQYFCIANPKLEWGNIYTGMPTYTESYEYLRCLEYYEVVPIALNQWADATSPNIVTRQPCRVRKQNAWRVQTIGVSTEEYLNTNMTVAAADYNHASQSAGIALTPGTATGYYWSGNIIVDASWNRELYEGP